MVTRPLNQKFGINIQAGGYWITMARIKQNKPAISAEARSFRAIRRLSLNRTYMPLKVGAIAGYILLGMLSASTSMFGILVGAMLRMIGL